MSAEEIARGLLDLEREWMTGWQGPRGAAFNVIATALLHKGLLKGPLDWALSPLGEEVRAILENERPDDDE
jgi:hypothetical protein